MSSGGLVGGAALGAETRPMPIGPCRVIDVAGFGGLDQAAHSIRLDAA